LRTKVVVCPAYRKRLRRGLSCLIFLWLAAIHPLFEDTASAENKPEIRERINTYATVCIADGRYIHVEVHGSGKQSLYELAKEIMQRPDQWRTFVTSSRLTIPYEHLNGRYKHLSISALFAKDTFSGGDWVHVVTFADDRRGHETLWRIATWFTGNGTTYAAIKQYNGLNSDAIHKGQQIKIPRSLLLPAFVEPQRIVTKYGELVFKPEGSEQYASYKIKKGESIYGHIIPRFTNSQGDKEAARACRQILECSGIRTPDTIWPGTEIRIPISILSEKYRPLSLKNATPDSGSQARTVGRLAGVALILDAGHGGEDPGTLGKLGTHEDDYVYDIMCRVKRLLERDTQARVLTTIIDGNSHYTVLDYVNFKMDKDEYLLTDPRYNNADPKFSVNLRWYLANSLFRKLVREGFDEENIVFTSFHADSLGSGVRGAMVYVPSAYHCRGRNGRNDRAYKRYREVREKPVVEFSWQQRQRSEELSSKFASTLIESFYKERVKVHDNPAVRGQSSPPTRSYIIRNRNIFVPGILRYNEVPVKVLLEVVNLNNVTDCQRIKSPRFREMVAEAYVRALYEFYGS
jgi:N-acetylmuramoyl-L-alanine amidase